MIIAGGKSVSRDTIRALTQVGQTRALTDEESGRLVLATLREGERQRKLPARIVALRALLHALESELWPEHALELARLQEEADEQRRADLDAEFTAHWGSEH